MACVVGWLLVEMTTTTTTTIPDRSARSHEPHSAAQSETDQHQHRSDESQTTESIGPIPSKLGQTLPGRRPNGCPQNVPARSLSRTPGDAESEPVGQMEAR